MSEMLRVIVILLTPGEYCFVQTLDAFSNVIGTSNEDCVTITPVLVLILILSL